MAFCLVGGSAIPLRDAWIEIMDVLINSLKTSRRGDIQVTVEVTWKGSSTVSEVTGKAKATMK